MKLIRNRGHGTGTLSLLAGNMIAADTLGLDGFHDFLGGAPGAGVIAVRIADWVVRLTTSTMVQGIDYARTNGAHVLSMSMGGLASDALADAVNLAYRAGIVLVTAAGNNLAWLPSPKSVVYPARFRRVLAACGVMADGRAYAGLSAGTMQGNYGPKENMATALGAYTPNVPWAQIDCGKIVDMDGGGTSAATPQIAAAAALWLAGHWDTVKAYLEPWMRVEAVREALFTSATKFTPLMNQAETKQKIGQGVLRAFDALAGHCHVNLARTP
jgi:subtilisin family serine protease